MKGFHIIIKDNFFEKELFEKLKIHISNYQFVAQHHALTNSNYNHVWFSYPTEKDIENIIKNKCENIFNKKFRVNFCSYTLLASVDPLPHIDLNDNCDHQIIIYIKGNTNLHKGTGFYLNNELNTHIGFNENRAVLWHSNTKHSPLNWASDDKSKRYSIICQLKEI